MLESGQTTSMQISNDGTFTGTSGDVMYWAYADENNKTFAYWASTPEELENTGSENVLILHEGVLFMYTATEAEGVYLVMIFEVIA